MVIYADSQNSTEHSLSSLAMVIKESQRCSKEKGGPFLFGSMNIVL